jgi:hypothetical protein
MTLRQLAPLLVLPLLVAQAAAQQEIGELDLMLERLAKYLSAYESQLAGVVADEHYEQQEIVVLRRNRAVSESVRDRKLDSHVTFLIGPGDPLWIGVRDVHRVDGRAVRSGAMRLDELVQSGDRRRVAQDVVKIVTASAAHNLGGARIINLPTTPLEILRPDRHVQFIFKVRGQDKIDGTNTKRLDFEEFDEPTLINSVDGVPLFIRGSAWIEPESGRLWRVELSVRPKPTAGTSPNVGNRLRVDFMLYAAWDIMVPKELSEEFFVIGGRGNGRARYSNYRRFTPVTTKGPPA